MLLSLFFLKLKGIIRFILLYLVDFFAININNFTHSNNIKCQYTKSLLLVRVDAIGDYVLFRNFIRLLRISKKYKDYKITLSGNIIWKDLAEQFDREYIEDFIWIDILKFRKNIFYRFKLLCDINKRKFDTAIQPTFSKDLYVGDAIMKFCRAKEKIGITGDFTNINTWQKEISDSYYTKLIDVSNNTLFEFDINKLIFKELLNIKLDIKAPCINIHNIDTFVITEPFAILFPGAGIKLRQWSTENFAKIGNYLHDKYRLHVIIAGNKSDTSIGQEINYYMQVNSVTDLTGKTNLYELCNLIRRAKLLISNETSAVHIAVAVNTLTICLSNGNHYSRFNPYPKEISDKIYTIYPPEIMKELNNNNEDKIIKKYRKGSNLNINLIEVEHVRDLVDKIFNN